MKRRGLRGSPCFTPPSSENVVVVLCCVVRHALTCVYMDLIMDTHCGCRPMVVRWSKSRPLCTRSKAPLKSTKHMYRGLLWSLAKCNAEWVRKVPSRVPLCVLNPNCGVRLSRRGVSRIAVSTMTEKSLRV